MFFKNISIILILQCYKIIMIALKSIMFILNKIYVLREGFFKMCFITVLLLCLVTTKLKSHRIVVSCHVSYHYHYVTKDVIYICIN